MFIIEKDTAVNLDIMNGILNTMIYCLCESTTTTTNVVNNMSNNKKKIQHDNIYKLELPTNFFSNDRVDFEKYIKIQGQEQLPEGVSIRAAILQLSSDVLLRAASGNLRSELWGDEGSTMPLVRQLFIGKESE